MTTTVTNLRIDRCRYNVNARSFTADGYNGDVSGIGLEEILPADFLATATHAPDHRTRVAKVTFYVKVEYE